MVTTAFLDVRTYDRFLKICGTFFLLFWYQFNCPNPIFWGFILLWNQFFLICIFFCSSVNYFCCWCCSKAISVLFRCYPVHGESLLKTRQTNGYELLSCLYWGSQERLVERVQTLSHIGLGSRPDIGIFPPISSSWHFLSSYFFFLAPALWSWSWHKGGVGRDHRSFLTGPGVVRQWIRHGLMWLFLSHGGPCWLWTTWWGQSCSTGWPLWWLLLRSWDLCIAILLLNGHAPPGSPVVGRGSFMACEQHFPTQPRPTSFSLSSSCPSLWSQLLP